MEAKDSKLKIGRAEDNFDTLKSTIKTFLDAHPYPATLYPDPKPPYFGIFTKRDWDVPVEWSLQIGEFCHNARSALDILAYTLTGLAVDDKLGERTAFPICNALADFPKHGVKKSKLEWVQLADYTKIERLQPYHRIGSTIDPLIVLQTLNNTDKHRLITVVDAVVNVCGGLAIKMPHNTKIGFISDMQIIRIFSCEVSCNETKVAEVVINGPMNMNMEPEITTEIQFGAACGLTQHSPVLETLAGIVDRVKEIVREFDPSVV